MQLQGKVAIVTGASKGIGKAIAVGFGKEGASVLVNYNTDKNGADEAVSAIVEAGQKAVAVQADTSKPQSAAFLVEQAVKTFGGLDIFVNNAGILRVAPLVDMDPSQWDCVVRTNLYGYFYCAQAAARQLIKQKRGGRIINISSISDPMVFIGGAAYCATKGGIDALTRVLAVELAKYGITANVIQPGPTDTPLNYPYYTPDVVERYNARIPIGRLAKAEEIVGAAVYLASDSASFTNGAEILIDGGLKINGEVGHHK
ncbi:MAG: 3-oxoacyl-ACP reductase family protein [Spirochaetia bacterium]|jgi:glucose 1-dehydrogenase